MFNRHCLNKRRVTRQIFSWGILFVIVACKSQAVGSKMESIFGADNRVALPKSYSFIGQLGTGCTGFAIAPRLILTAAHCTFSNGEHPWIANGTSEKFETTLLARGMTGSNADRRGQLYGAEVSSDWALLKLDRPTKKWLAVSSDAKEGDKVAVVGYSYDLPGATGHNNCQVRSLSHNVISHDCDLQGGVSGGPIMKWGGDGWMVIGVQSTEHCEKSDCKNDKWTQRNSNKGCYLGSEILEQIQGFQSIYRD